MATTTLSSREFDHDTSRAKRAATNGPVFITDRGRPAHVLMTIDEYHRLARSGPSLADLLGDEKAGAIDFDLPPRTIEPIRPIDW